jgi:hypothetical protein
MAFYKRSFDASSADALADGAEAFAEMSPDDQAFHAAHLQYRQVQALGDVFAVLPRIEARLARLDSVCDATKHLPTMRKALVRIARGQQALLGGLEAAVNGDRDDDDGGEEPDDDEDLDVDGEDEEDDAEEIEEEDHGNGDEPEVVVPDEVIPARREPPEAA